MDLATRKTSKSSRAKSYGLPLPKPKESIRAYSRRLGISFYKARYVVEGKKYRQTKSQREYYREGYRGRVEGMLKRYRNLYGDYDVRFNGEITPRKIMEFKREIINRYDLQVLDSSRAYRKGLSKDEKERIERTAEFLQIPERRIKEVYVSKGV